MFPEGVRYLYPGGSWDPNELEADIFFEITYFSSIQGFLQDIPSQEPYAAVTNIFYFFSSSPGHTPKLWGTCVSQAVGILTSYKQIYTWETLILLKSYQNFRLELPKSTVRDLGFSHIF